MTRGLALYIETPEKCYILHMYYIIQNTYYVDYLLHAEQKWRVVLHKHNPTTLVTPSVVLTAGT